MFLDEKLEKIQSENLDWDKRAIKLITACFENLNETTLNTYLDSLKHVDYSWKLFCKKHKEYNINGFKNCVLKCVENKAIGVYKKALGW